MAEKQFEEIKIKTEIKIELELEIDSNTNTAPNNHVEIPVTKEQPKIKNETDNHELTDNVTNKDQILEIEITGKVYENGKINRLACPICSETKSFKNRASLKQHLKFVHPSVKDEVTCEECLKTFKSISSLRSHISSVHVKDELVKCDNCDKTFSNKKRLLNHIYYSHPEPKEKVSCHICSKEFKMNYSLKIHMRTVHPVEEKSVNCPYCEKVFKLDMLLKRHIKWSHPSDGLMYKCTSCNRMLPSMACYKKHWENVHSGLLEATCDICLQKFKTGKSLQRHISCVHGDKKPLPKNLNVGTIPCSECSRKFATNTALLWHVERCHTNYSPNACKLCSIKITDPDEMQVHMEVEHDIKSFKCSICQKAFRSYNSMRKHEDSVHNEDNLACTICNKTFKSASHLQRHIKVTHAPPEAAVKCEICQKTYKCSMHLRIHVNAVHSKHGAFTCEICNKEFSSKKYLVKHTKSHVTSKDFPCLDCGKFYKNLNQVNRHRKRVHGKKNAESPVSNCPKCSTTFRSDMELHAHISSCGNEMTRIDPYDIEVKVEIIEDP